MDLLGWLQELGQDADPLMQGFQPQPLYLVICVFMPLAIGLAVGFGLRTVERILGVQRTPEGGH